MGVTEERVMYSPHSIKRLYFGTELIPSPSMRAEEALTVTARYIANCVRQQLSRVDLKGRAPTEAELLQLIKAVEERENEELSPRERTALLATLVSVFDDFDVLDGLVHDVSVNDIICRDYDDISVQRGRANFQTGISFSDRHSYKAFVERLLKKAGKSCSVATPLIDAALGANTRVCVTHESLTPEGLSPLLTIRIARHSKVSLETLHQGGLAPREVLDYLRLLVESGECTILIAGEVGTGKTTLVRALAAAVPEEEALLIIEDTQEIRLERRFSRTLLTRDANSEGFGRVTSAQAIRTGMRMAMNRIILGEMRDAEAAESFIDASASGHPGMSTIHARSGRDAIARLELFLRRAQGDVGMDTIRRQISGAVSAVVYLGVDKSSRARRIVEILEIGSSADGLIQLSPMFSYIDAGEPTWRRESGVSSFQLHLLKRGYELPKVGQLYALPTQRQQADV